MSQRAGGERDQLRSRSRVGSARKSTKMGEGVGVLEVGRHDSGKAVWFNLPAWLEVNDSCRNSQLFLSTRGERGFIGSRAVGPSRGGGTVAGAGGSSCGGRRGMKVDDTDLTA